MVAVGLDLDGTTVDGFAWIKRRRVSSMASRVSSMTAGACKSDLWCSKSRRSGALPLARGYANLLLLVFSCLFVRAMRKKRKKRVNYEAFVNFFVFVLKLSCGVLVFVWNLDIAL